MIIRSNTIDQPISTCICPISFIFSISVNKRRNGYHNNTTIVDKLFLSIQSEGHFKSVQSWNMLWNHSYDSNRRNQSKFRHCPLWDNIRRSSTWLIWQKNTLTSKMSNTTSNILFYHLIREIAGNRFLKNCSLPWLNHVNIFHIMPRHSYRLTLRSPAAGSTISHLNKTINHI